MNLLFIYGPPATGKLTIAKEISKLINYPIFHNHLTRDLVDEIFHDALLENYALVHNLRYEVFRYCAMVGQDIIFTYVYDGESDEKNVQQMTDIVTKSGGKVLFVELTAPDDVLLKRVTNQSRKLHKKLNDADALKKLLANITFASVPYTDVLKIDTSLCSPQLAAKAIIDHYKLTSASPVSSDKNPL